MLLLSLLSFVLLSVGVSGSEQGSWFDGLANATNITAYESDTVVISCPIRESDEYVEWRVDNEFHRKRTADVHEERRITYRGLLNRPFELLGRYNVSTDTSYSNLSHLTVTKVNLSEAGSYFCYDQWQNERRHVIHLDVLVNLSTLQNLVNQSKYVGDNAIIPCVVNATHSVELQFIASSQAPHSTIWNGYVQDKRLAGRILQVTTETSEAFNLLMTNIQRDDTGYYVCIENRDGDKRAHGVFISVQFDSGKNTPRTSTDTLTVLIVLALEALIGMISLVVFNLIWIKRGRSRQTGFNFSFRETVDGQDTTDKRPLLNQSVPTVPYEILERILLKAASKLHNTVYMKPPRDIATLTTMSSVCMEWWFVLMKSRGSKQRARRWLRVYEWMRFPMILQTAAFLMRRIEKAEPLGSRDANAAALKALCTCRHWWVTMTSCIDVNRQQIKQNFAKVPGFLSQLNKDNQNVESNNNKSDGEIFQSNDDADNRLVESSFNLESSSSLRHQPHQQQAADLTNYRRELRGVTHADNKIFVLYDVINITEDYNSDKRSLFVEIDVFSDRRPFDELFEIKITEFKNSRDIVACSETLKLFVGDGSRDIWRVDIKTYDCQRFVEVREGTVVSMSLSCRHLLVTSFRSSLTVFDVMNGEMLQFIALSELTFGQTFHAIESTKQTFYVSHKNASSDYCQISEVNFGGQVVCSSGPHLKLRDPRHLAFDSVGCLLVANSWGSHRILLLNEELKLKQVLLEYEELHWSERLHYNKKTNQLIVGFWNRHFVNVYQCRNSIKTSQMAKQLLNKNDCKVVTQCLSAE